MGTVESTPLDNSFGVLKRTSPDLFNKEQVTKQDRIATSKARLKAHHLVQFDQPRI